MDKWIEDIRAELAMVPTSDLIAEIIHLRMREQVLLADITLLQEDVDYLKEDVRYYRHRSSRHGD